MSLSRFTGHIGRMKKLQIIMLSLVTVVFGCRTRQLDEASKHELIQQRLSYFSNLTTVAEDVSDLVANTENRWTVQRGALVWQGEDSRCEDARFQLFLAFPSGRNTLNKLSGTDGQNARLATKIEPQPSHTVVEEFIEPTVIPASAYLSAKETRKIIETKAEIPIPERADTLSLRYELNLHTGQMTLEAEAYHSDEKQIRLVKENILSLGIPFQYLYLAPNPDSESSTALNDEYAGEIREISKIYLSRKLPEQMTHIAVGTSLYGVLDLEEYSEQKSAFIAHGIMLTEGETVYSVFYSQLSPHKLRDNYVGIRNIPRAISQLAIEPSRDDKQIRTIFDWPGQDRLQTLVQPFETQAAELRNAFLSLRKIAWNLDPIKVTQWMENKYRDIPKKRAEAKFIPCFAARPYRNLYFALMRGNDVGVVRPVRMGSRTYLIIGTENEVNPIVRVIEKDLAEARSTAFEYIPDDQLKGCRFPLLHYNSAIYPDFAGLITAVCETETGNWPRLGYDGIMDSHDTRMGTSIVWKTLRGIKNQILNLVR